MPTSNLVKEDTVFLQLLKFCSFLNKKIYNALIRKQVWSTLSWQKLIKVFFTEPSFEHLP